MKKLISPNIFLMQKDKNTDIVRISYESPKTPTRTYEYNLKTKEKNLLRNKRFHLAIIEMIILLSV